MITEELASIKKRIQDYGFKRLLLAVSGGLDSICLAHYFIQNREALGIEWLGIAHVHHGLREGSADRDAAFVEAFARRYDIPFFLKKLDGEALKAAEGSLEENARSARYKALFEIIEESLLRRDDVYSSEIRPPNSEFVIVTAHHAGDQAETMYMRLRRGTTLAGLRGIRTVSTMSRGVSPHHNSEIRTPNSEFSFVYLYRPLLNTTRAELLGYAREHNLTWCEDESNTDVKFARNKVRHEWLPQLEQSNAGAATQLCKVAELADKAYGKVISACEELFSPALCKVPLRQAQGDSNINNGLLLPKGDNSTKATSCQVSYSFVRNDILLNKKALRKVLLAHADADLSEMFRQWLSEQGFRFPIGFFFAQNEPAHIKIPHRSAYRKRVIVKNGSTIRICEFSSVEAALKFVSCKTKD